MAATSFSKRYRNYLETSCATKSKLINKRRMFFTRTNKYSMKKL